MYHRSGGDTSIRMECSKHEKREVLDEPPRMGRTPRTKARQTIRGIVRLAFNGTYDLVDDAHSRGLRGPSPAFRWRCWTGFLPPFPRRLCTKMIGRTSSPCRQMSALKCFISNTRGRTHGHG